MSILRVSLLSNILGHILNSIGDVDPEHRKEALDKEEKGKLCASSGEFTWAWSWWFLLKMRGKVGQSELPPFNGP